jgi:RNA methyltransferase, TrmH family
MEGESLYDLKLPADALIVMGNEGNGIRPEVAENISNKLSIPSFNSGKTEQSL